MSSSINDTLINIFKDWHKDVVSDSLKLTEHLDKLIVWLIGLSTGSVVLIFSSLDKLDFVSRSTINYTLGLLVASIILGVIGRIFYAVALYLGYYMSSLFTFQLKLLDLPLEPREINDNHTAEDVYKFLLEDFKVNMPSILENKKNSLKENWAKIDENARDIYEDHRELIYSNLLEAMKSISKITIDSFGFKDNYFETHKNKSNRLRGKIFRFLTYSSYSFYILSALFFGSSIMYFFIRYLNSAS